MNEIQELQEELEKTKLAYQIVAEISQFKSSFLGKISHELRAPLSSLMSIHQLILSDLCESHKEEREFIARAYENAQILMRLIDEVITVSKIEYGSLSLDCQPVKLSEILARLESLTCQQAATKHISLKIIPPHQEITIFTDSERCLQGLVILVDTVISHVETGSIKVTASMETNANFAEIMLDFPGKIECWQETDSVLPEMTVALSNEAVKHGEKIVKTSPFLKFILMKSLFQKMGGDWQIFEKLPNEIICLQGTLPTIKN